MTGNKHQMSLSGRPVRSHWYTPHEYALRLKTSVISLSHLLVTTFFTKIKALNKGLIMNHDTSTKENFQDKAPRRQLPHIQA